MPITAATTTLTAAPDKPMITEVRAPKMIRLSTSRPRWSAPRRYFSEGGVSRSGRLRSFIPWGARKSAKMPMSSANRTIVPATAPSGFSRLSLERNSNSGERLSPATGATTSRCYA